MNKYIKHIVEAFDFGSVKQQNVHDRINDNIKHVMVAMLSFSYSLCQYNLSHIAEFPADHHIFSVPYFASFLRIRIKHIPQNLNFFSKDPLSSDLLHRNLLYLSCIQQETYLLPQPRSLHLRIRSRYSRL